MNKLEKSKRARWIDLEKSKWAKWIDLRMSGDYEQIEAFRKAHADRMAEVMAMSVIPPLSSPPNVVDDEYTYEPVDSTRDDCYRCGELKHLHITYYISGDNRVLKCRASANPYKDDPCPRCYTGDRDLDHGPQCKRLGHENVGARR